MCIAYQSGSNAKIYNPVEYKGTVKVNGEIKDVSRKVYQRNDIDFNYFDETTGLTNLERMQAGKPPIGSDGNPIQLHHILQKEVGPMVEIREITHQEYYSQLLITLNIEYPAAISNWLCLIKKEIGKKIRYVEGVKHSEDLLFGAHIGNGERNKL